MLYVFLNQIDMAKLDVYRGEESKVDLMGSKTKMFKEVHDDY